MEIFTPHVKIDTFFTFLSLHGFLNIFNFYIFQFYFSKSLIITILPFPFFLTHVHARHLINPFFFFFLNFSSTLFSHSSNRASHDHHYQALTNFFFPRSPSPSPHPRFPQPTLSSSTIFFYINGNH
jgi:hypothetical protein